MRKIKKINGYLIVKFNDRELREWEGTCLGNYGVIDAELYTGCLDVDRGVMEYDSAETIDEAIEQARGLESEEDISEEPARYTICNETAESFVELEVSPTHMIADYRQQLDNQITTPHHPNIDTCTAVHELHGFVLAFERLGLVPRGEYSVDADCFMDGNGNNAGTFIHGQENVPLEKCYRLGQALIQDCPFNDCVVYRNIFERCLELDGQIDRVTGLARSTLEAALNKHQRELYSMWIHNYAISEYRRELREKKTEPPMEGAAPKSVTVSLKASPLYPYGEHGELLVDRPYRATDAAEYRRRLRESYEELQAIRKLFREIEDYATEGSHDRTSQSQE